MAGARAQITQSCIVHGGTFGYFGVKLEGTGELEAGVKYDLIYALKVDGRQGQQGSYNGEDEHDGAL